MKIQIESTTRVVNVNGMDCRVWEGATESGIEVQALIVRIAAPDTADLRQFNAELKETKPPSAVVAAFPARMII